MEGIDMTILESIKEQLGGYHDEDTTFDKDILALINSQIAVLVQLGVLQEMTKVDDTTKWDDLIDNDLEASLADTYMYLKVRLLFDTPTSSSVATEFKEQADEMQWRLYAIHNKAPELKEEDE